MAEKESCGGTAVGQRGDGPDGGCGIRDKLVQTYTSPQADHVISLAVAAEGCSVYSSADGTRAWNRAVQDLIAMSAAEHTACG